MESGKTTANEHSCEVNNRMAQRKKDGTFAPGNTIAAGHGRPPRQTETAYMAATIGAVSLDDWTAIVQKAVSDAKDGDAKAREWLTKILIGDKPSLSIVLAKLETGADDVESEIRRMEENKRMAELFNLGF